MPQATKSRPNSRPVSSGPTRTRAGRRSKASPTTRAGAKGAAHPSTPQSGTRRAWLTLPGGFGVTRRAIALVVVVLMLGISYANSIRIYFSQEAEIAELRIEAQQRQQSIDELNYELTRWQDENYVRAMARDRLGWVVPGEVGYRVIGADGQPIGSSIDRQARIPQSDVEPEQPWWEKVQGGIAAADHPTPVAEEPADPAKEEPLTADGEKPKDADESAEGTRMIDEYTEADAAVVELQLHRRPRAVVRVGWRCHRGRPGVIVTEPRLPDGTAVPHHLLPDLSLNGRWLFDARGLRSDGADAAAIGHRTGTRGGL